MSSEELVAAIQAGATERMGELWEQVQLFVIKQARHVPLDGRADVELDDLIQSGYLALVNAVAVYQPGGYSFLTCLNYHLKTAFAEATRFRSLRQQRETLAGALFLDAPVSGDADASTLGYFKEDATGVEALEDVEEQIYQAQLRKAMASVLADLPEGHRELLQLRYWEDATLQEIADIQGTTPERIRQKENKAIRELRKPRNACRLRSFYDFNSYFGTSLRAFQHSGMSVQERYLVIEEERQEREKHQCQENRRQKEKSKHEVEDTIERINQEAQERVNRMTPEEKRALLEKYGYA